jgi:hypothetical protein
MAGAVCEVGSEARKRSADSAGGGEPKDSSPLAYSVVARPSRKAPIHRLPLLAYRHPPRLHAAGLDRGVWHLMTGLPYPVRLAGYGLWAPKTSVPGMDMAGTVEAVSKDVTRVRPGNEVFGVGKGAFAEHARVVEDKVAPKPAHSPSSRRAWSPLRARPPCRHCAIMDGCGRGRRS